METIEPTCAECLAPTAEPLTTRSGATLCAACAAEFYATCAECKGLVPAEETTSRDGLPYCPECFASAFGGPSDEDLEGLVAEYVALHAEHKKLTDRLDDLKERLKAAAMQRERTAGAVTLKSDTGTVKCSFSVKPKWDQERVAELEPLLGPERFASLFERKVTFSPVKGAVDGFLSSASEADADARAALESAFETVETPTITVVPPKKK